MQWTVEVVSICDNLGILSQRKDFLPSPGGEVTMLSANAESKLLAWLGASTWHTSHDCDMDRWYAFVDQYQKDHGYTIDEPVLREYIEGKVEGDVNEDLREIISNQIGLAYNILDFLKCTGR